MGKLIKFPFTKWQGCGNDFVMIDGFANAIAEENYAAVSKAACDRHYGIGADGILLLVHSDGYYGMRMFNPDGSEAQMCGNG
ncbi:MAG: diaminopimelate epimerase, partial [Selenomonadaceae bacterium]|nr:diaminopimelate epimerase [Selenomonadaceae bacterium]